MNQPHFGPRCPSQPRFSNSCCRASNAGASRSCRFVGARPSEPVWKIPRAAILLVLVVVLVLEIPAKSRRRTRTRTRTNRSQGFFTQALSAALRCRQLEGVPGYSRTADSRMPTRRGGDGASPVRVKPDWKLSGTSCPHPFLESTVRIRALFGLFDCSRFLISYHPVRVHMLTSRKKNTKILSRFPVGEPKHGTTPF